MKKNLLTWFVILTPLLTILVFTQRDIGSPNDASRIATIQAIIENHTFALDSVPLREAVDIMKHDGHTYSDKPPMLQVLGAGIYYILYHSGITFSTHPAWVYYILTFILVGIPFVLINYILYKIFLLHEIHPKQIFILFLLSWLGTISLPYSITFVNHSLTALCILLSVYLYMQVEIFGKPLKAPYFWMGFFTGFAFTLEFTTGGLMMAGFFFLLLLRKKSTTTIGKYILGAIIPLLISSYCNRFQTGDWIPAYLHQEFYKFPGSVWGGELGKKRLFGRSIPSQLFHMLVGYRGIFLFSPLLVLGFIQSIRIACKKTHPYRGLSFLTLISFLGTMVFFALINSDFGGGSYGLRYVIGVLPLLIFFTGLWFKDHLARPKHLWVPFLLFFSILFSCIGLFNPWPENILSPCPILENIGYMTFSPELHRTWLTEQIIEHSSLEKGLAYYEIARKSRDKEAMGEAVRYFNLSMKYDPSHILTYYHLGIVLDLLGRPDLAVPVYEKLLQLDPENTGGMNNFGISLLHLENYPGAEIIYRHSIVLDPSKYSAHIGLTRALFEQKKYNEAFEEVKTCLKIYPESQEAQSIYSKLLPLINPDKK